MGVIVGLDEGTDVVGAFEGPLEGVLVGVPDGLFVGRSEGVFVGLTDGAVGPLVGAVVGMYVKPSAVGPQTKSKYFFKSLRTNSILKVS